MKRPFSPTLLPEEVPLTFKRFIKIYWSITWRHLLLIATTLILLCVLAAIVTLIAPNITSNCLAFLKQFNPRSNIHFFLIALSFIGVIHIISIFYIDYFVFKLVIGKNYKDFKLNFHSAYSYNKNRIFKITLRYFSILSIGTILLKTLKTYLKLHLFPNSSEFIYLIGNSVLLLLSFSLVFYPLYYILNRTFGDTRLSLLKKDKHPDPHELLVAQKES